MEVWDSLWSCQIPKKCEFLTFYIPLNIVILIRFWLVSKLLRSLFHFLYNLASLKTGAPKNYNIFLLPFQNMAEFYWNYSYLSKSALFEQVNFQWRNGTGVLSFQLWILVWRNSLVVPLNSVQLLTWVSCTLTQLTTLRCLISGCSRLFFSTMHST